MSTLKVDAIRHNSATSDAITTAADGTCTAKLTSAGGGQLSNRNLVINGAMNVAQRGTSSTSSGYHTVDRFRFQYGGTEENPTQAQSSLSSSDTPYSFGFRKSYKITNGNQTGGADANNLLYIRHQIESQNIATSGWNYTDSNSFITLQFWVKASVAQDYHFHARAVEGTGQVYPMEMTLSANTWTKVVRTIPGNSNISSDNDNTDGFHINFHLYTGTDYTSSSANNDQWQAYSGSIFGGKDQTTTWYTTNDATFEITGVQLEVGDTATSFEHRSHAEELELCKRYYQQVYFYWNTGSTNSNYLYYVGGQFHPVMRAAPSLVAAYDNNNENSFETRDGGTWRTGLPSLIEAQPEGIVLRSNNNVVFNAIKGIAHFNAEL